MKIIIAKGGLGNIMFQYAFACALKKRFNEESILFVSDTNIHHTGYQLDKIFNIDRFQYLRFYQKYYIKFLEYLRNKRLPHLAILFPRRRNVQDGFGYNGMLDKDSKNGYYIGDWQSEKYFFTIKNEIFNIFKFDESILSEQSILYMQQINSYNSVSIHIRRGDYLTPYYKSAVGESCTLEYYEKAISIINEKVEDPTFFVFSDDIEFAKQNLKANKIVFVDHNKADDSWQDMYLMSKCKHNIIANSTFSWWAAYLNKNREKIIIAPELWWKGFDTSDVIPDSWIKTPPLVN